MKLTKKDRWAINKLTAEMIGYTEIKKYKGELFGWEPNTPQPIPSKPDVGFVLRHREIIPDFCGENEAALKALQSLPSSWSWNLLRIKNKQRKKNTGVYYYITIEPPRTRQQKKEETDSNVDGDGETIAAALRDATTKVCCMSDYCGDCKEFNGWLLRPALKAALKAVRKEKK